MNSFYENDKKFQSIVGTLIKIIMKSAINQLNHITITALV